MNPYIIILLFLFVGILLGVIAGLMTLSRRQKLEEYTYETEALVSDMISGADGWMPEYQYRFNGVDYTKRRNVYTSWKPYEIGDKVKIKVNPENPEQFVLIQSGAFSLSVKILTAISVCFILGAAMSAVLVRKSG